MSGIVCYLQRDAGGSLIQRVRLVGPGLDRSWIGDAGSSSAPINPGAALGAARAAARWVAEQLGRSRRELACVSIDSEGGLCMWVSSPSADPAILAAAMMTSETASLDEGDNGSRSEGSPLAVAATGVGLERSLQALDSTTVRARPSRRGAGEERRRLAVLSVPDAPVRVFLDELDSLKVEVRAVGSLWHAMSLAWDPSANRGPAAHDLQRALEREAAQSSPVTAVVLMAQPGRLIWSWSVGGDLLAGGTIRLRSIDLAEPEETAEPEDLGSTRRLPSAVAEDSKRALVCTRTDIGRLTTDWLAWASQIGRSPARIILVGPDTASDPLADPGAFEPDPVEMLVGAWHGAPVDARRSEDPVGDTLARLAQRPDDDSIASDPRVAMVELSRRPGRPHRRMYRWMALATLALSGLIGVLGWRLSTEAARVDSHADDAQAEIMQSMAEFATDIPGILQAPDPVAMLRSKINELKRSRTTIEHEPPILAEFQRVMDAIAGHEGVKLEQLTFHAVTPGSVLISLPEADASAGSSILLQLRQSTGVMSWRGESAGSPGTARRQYRFDGTWPTRRREGAGS
ncbi:MAG: hypothetical protein KF745_07100 [Phycisphaeraceae bacterium]|nr:hypothetical protein [Phycisphaeraceae bacterium]